MVLDPDMPASSLAERIVSEHFDDPIALLDRLTDEQPVTYLSLLDTVDPDHRDAARAQLEAGFLLGLAVGRRMRGGK
jgi:hypothetical protein